MPFWRGFVHHSACGSGDIGLSLEDSVGRRALAPQIVASGRAMGVGHLELFWAGRSAR